MKQFKAGLVLGLICLGTTSYSHSGGLNSHGCHAGSKPYHCHRAASDMVSSSSGGYRLKCSLGSRSKDCVGSITSADTLSTSDVLWLQTRLAVHCSGIGAGFVDGILG